MQPIVAHRIGSASRLFQPRARTPPSEDTRRFQCARDPRLQERGFWPGVKHPDGSMSRARGERLHPMWARTTTTF